MKSLSTLTDSYLRKRKLIRIIRFLLFFSVLLGNIGFLILIFYWIRYIRLNKAIVNERIHAKIEIRRSISYGIEKYLYHWNKYLEITNPQ